MLLGIGHGLSGIDSAWIFQPYLACCGAAIALGMYALAEPLVASPDCALWWRSWARSRRCCTAMACGVGSRS